MPPETPLNVVVGVAGGIAAYKAVNVVRELVLAGHDVHVIPTDAALKFVGAPTFEAISRNDVHTGLYDGVAEVRHVALGQAADLVIIAPATANTLAKLAHGIADDLLGTTVLATSAPLVVAPAMHTEMWSHPATQANVVLLRERGVRIVGPESGRLTGRDSGPGRMSEPRDIVDAALGAVSNRRARPAADLAGKRVVVTAGGTREPLDPVRFLGNRSSGRQGVALAQAAAARGAEVTLIAAHLDVPTDGLGLAVTEVGTASELRDAVVAAAGGADAVVMAAAVADYRPADVSDGKLKKSDDPDEGLTLQLVRNPDILAELGATKQPGLTLIGFAAETEPDDDALLRIGRAKLARKHADFLVLNRVGWSTGFGTADTSVTVLSEAGDIVVTASGSKLDVAHRILDLLT